MAKIKLEHSDIKLKHVYDINEASINIMKKQFIKEFFGKLHINDLAKLVNLTVEECDSGNEQYPEGFKLSCFVEVDKTE